VLAAPTSVGGGATTFVTLRRIVIEPPFTAHPVSGHIPGLSFTDTSITAAAFGFSAITTRGIAYDDQNDRVLLAIVDASIGTGGPRYLISYSSDQGVVWMVPVGSNDELRSLARFAYGQIWMYGGGAVTVRSAEDGEILFRQTGFPHVTGVGRLLFDPGSNVLYPSSGGSAPGAYQIIAGRGSETSVGLYDVVSALCARVGLMTSDLDVSELTADEVRGFGIARQISVRGALELLATTYAFEAIESDHQLKFKKRGRDPSRVISEDDLAPLSDRETFRETRAQEVDLPLRFSVRYQDADLDAEEGTQTAKRIAGPDATNRARLVQAAEPDGRGRRPQA
jgi:Putative phage tail protein